MKIKYWKEVVGGFYGSAYITSVTYDLRDEKGQTVGAAITVHPLASGDDRGKWETSLRQTRSGIGWGKTHALRSFSATADQAKASAEDLVAKHMLSCAKRFED